MKQAYIYDNATYVQVETTASRFIAYLHPIP